MSRAALRPTAFHPIPHRAILSINLACVNLQFIRSRFTFGDARLPPDAAVRAGLNDKAALDPEIDIRGPFGVAR